MSRTLAIIAVLTLAGGAASAQTPAPGAASPMGASPMEASPSAAPALTEGQARSIMMDSGCSNVSHLSMSPAGSWHGTCTKGGQTAQVMVDPKGKVAPAAGVDHLTAAHARSALMDYGCSNVSTLSSGPQGSWHGTCTKGGQTVNLMVDQNGKVAPSTAAGHITEGQARSVLMDFGCSNISTLSSGTDGNWSGMCTKGGTTSMVRVDQQGKASTAK
jgi:hypothetical protein